MPVLPQMTPFAFAAHHVVLDEYQIAFLEALATRKLAARFGDVTDILVAHDHRRWGGRRLIHLDVGSTDAADFHFEQSAIRRDIRQGKIANLGLARSYSYSSQYF